jgi:predicted  nucleic acid-binding Zn-ribbon protein
MKKSYSKIRHIQETNERLEKEFLEEQKLLNKLRAGIEGAGANIQARAGNMFGKEKIRKNPKLQGLLAKIKTRQEYLRKQLEYMTTELNEYSQELAALKTATPDYQNEISQVENQTKAYVQSISNAIAQGDALTKFNVQYVA